MDIQTLYHKSLEFAAEKHEGKKKKNDQPYIVHVCDVATEVLVASFHTADMDIFFAIQVALLHDTIEDTDTTYEEIKMNFGEKVAEAVLALTKFTNLPKEQQMPDSLRRIQKLQKEVWAVKLGDRITNLKPPPKDWDKEKIIKYRDGAIQILNHLKDGNSYLAKRLQEKIKAYEQFIPK